MQTYEDILASLKSVILTEFYAQKPPVSVSCRIFCIRDRGILNPKPEELQVYASDGAPSSRHYPCS